MNEQRITYVCDPELHTECNKRTCHINGGVCNRTKYLKFAKQPVEIAELSMPMSQEDFDSLTAESTKIWPKLEHHHPKRKGGSK